MSISFSESMSECAYIVFTSFLHMAHEWCFLLASHRVTM